MKKRKYLINFQSTYCNFILHPVAGRLNWILRVRFSRNDDEGYCLGGNGWRMAFRGIPLGGGRTT